MDLSHDELMALSTGHSEPVQSANTKIPVPSEEVKKRAKEIKTGKRKVTGGVIEDGQATGVVDTLVSDADKSAFVFYLVQNKPFTKTYSAFGHTKFGFCTISIERDAYVKKLAEYASEHIKFLPKEQIAIDIEAIASLVFIKTSHLPIIQTMLTENTLFEDGLALYKTYLNSGAYLMRTIRQLYAEFKNLLMYFMQRATNQDFWVTQSSGT